MNNIEPINEDIRAVKYDVNSIKNLNKHFQP